MISEADFQFPDLAHASMAQLKPHVVGRSPGTPPSKSGEVHMSLSILRASATLPSLAHACCWKALQARGFDACHTCFTIDHPSLPRWSTVHFPKRNTSNIGAFSTFSKHSLLRKTSCLYFPIPDSPGGFLAGRGFFMGGGAIIP